MGSAELNDFVKRVSERTDVYSVVSAYVPLTQKSGRYWGRCPFHNEKTASFSVSADKGLFYCFGCGAGGNIFKFLSLIENISYFEAVKLQARRLGIDLPEKKYSPEEERRRREEKILYRINELAQDFYYEYLTKTARGEIGRKYLAGRGITAETIENFKLGYAPDEWENLLTKFTRQDFSPQQLEAVGLVAKRKNSSGYYDRFRGRVMIPIIDVFGHVVGFGGRVLNSEDENSPKYLNTPETVLFNKRNLLFGLDKSNRAISAAGAAIVVEGYMDAISLFSAGVKNVVATLGTAFTPEHAKLIQRYARKIIFCYDNDDAGQRATIRALPIVQQAGAEVYVVKISDGKDPDEFIRKHGKEKFEELIKSAQTLIDYRIKYVLANTEHATTGGKFRALQEILPVVVNIENDILCAEYCKRISAALVLDEQLVAKAWKKFLKQMQETAHQPGKKFIAVKRQKIFERTDPIIRASCEVVLRMVWHENDMIDYVLTVLPTEIFSEPQREILFWLKNYEEQGRRANQMNAAEELSDEANAQLSRILMDGSDEPLDTEIKLFNDSVNILRRDVLLKKYHRILAQSEGYKSGDQEIYNKSIQELIKVKKEIDNLKGN